MKARSIKIVISIISLLVLTFGCKSADSKGLESFLDAWQQQGYEAEHYAFDPKFLSIKSERIDVGSEAIDIYEYDSVDAMEMDAGGISKEGFSFKKDNLDIKVSWIAIPHFYKYENLIVQYVGEDPGIIEDLEAICGEAFAGGDANAGKN